MRSFLTTHWKAIVALIVLVFLAVLTMSPSAGSGELGTRLRERVTAIAARGINGRGIDAALANIVPGEPPARIFIIGARHDPGAGSPTPSPR